MTIRHYYAEMTGKTSDGVFEYRFTTDSIAMNDFGQMIVNFNNETCEISMPMTDNNGWGWAIDNKNYCVSCLSERIFLEYEIKKEPPRQIEYIT